MGGIMESRATSPCVRAQGEVTTGNRRSGLERALVRAVSLAAFVACIGIPSLALANNNAGLRTIPLHFSNHINQAQNLYILIFGIVNRDNGKGFPVGSNVYVTNTQGDVAITPAIPGNAPISLSLNVGMGTEIDLTLPKLSAVRIYSSLNAPLLVHTGGIMGGGIVTPTSQDPNDPNFNTMFDFAELTWVPQPPILNHPEITTNLGINVTEVDSFGLPQQFTIEGTDPATFQPNTALTSGFLSTARRPDLLNMLQSFGPPWSGLIVGNGIRARALAPNLGIAGGFFPSNYLDSYTNDVFLRYMSSPPLTSTLSAAANPATVPNCPNPPTIIYNFTGSTAGGELVFSDATKGGAIFSLARWSTMDAYAGFFAYGSVVPTDSCLRPDFTAGEAVKARLQAAQMRSTVLVDPNLADNPNCPNPSTYYQNQPLNKYAQLWHTAGIGGKAYSFGFDDNCSQSSFKLIFNPTKLTITLLGNRP
jgi:hypothetical protein